MDPEAKMEEKEQTTVADGWAWKRPTLQQVKSAINIYYRDSIIKNIQDVLQHVGGDETIHQFRSGCFGHFLDYRGGYNCNKALHALMAHEVVTPSARDDEVWFHVGSKHIKFSKVEYALVTGLNFGESTFDPRGSHEVMPNGVYSRALGGAPLSVFDLWKKFNARHISGSSSDYLKVANVLFLYLMLFAYDPEKIIEGWVWVLVEDIARWNSFPWGAYTFQVLLHYIRKVPVQSSRLSKRKSYHFYGPVYALLIWAYEAIPELGRTCAVRDGVYPTPRCLMWTFPRLYKDFTSFFNQELACFETLKPTVEELKQPYWESLQCENPLGVRYMPRENPIKRRIPALNSATSSAEASVDVLIQQPSRSKKRVLINEAEGPTKAVKQPFKNEALQSHHCCCKHVCIDYDAFAERVMGRIVPRLTLLLEDLVQQIFEGRHASAPQNHNSTHYPSRADENASGGLVGGSPVSERVAVDSLHESPSGQRDDASSPAKTPQPHSQFESNGK